MSDKQIHEIKPAIDVKPGKDAHVIGKHYANLHQIEVERAYDQTGQKISTTYEIEDLGGGKKRVKIMETREHKS